MLLPDQTQQDFSELASLFLECKKWGFRRLMEHQWLDINVTDSTNEILLWRTLLSIGTLQVNATVIVIY